MRSSQQKTLKRRDREPIVVFFYQQQTQDQGPTQRVAALMEAVLE